MNFIFSLRKGLILFLTFHYSAFIFENFSEANKNILDNVILLITNEIKENYLDEVFLINYLDDIYNLEYINFTIDNFHELYEDLEDMIFYTNLIQNEEYKNYLLNLLIKSFNISYREFIDNYIILNIIDNISIYINDKLDIIIEQFKTKIILEYNYYLYILNKTEEIGNSTKYAFINLYSDI